MFPFLWVDSICRNNNNIEYLYSTFNKIKALHRNLEPRQKLDRNRKEERFKKFFLMSIWEENL